MKHLEDQRKIINSKAFRRLADKTQVIFSIDRDAQVRSRLTHSLEVASIAKEIALNIHNVHTYEINAECVYNVALLHDYGMSPLGHLGESTLQDVFFEKTGLVFEANANNLVVIEKNVPDISMLTILSTIKYPYLFKSMDDGKKSKGIYETQFDKYKPILDEIISLQNQYPEVPRERTYECDIMELADDLAYLLSDLSDAIFSYKIQITKEELSKYFQEESLVNPDMFMKLETIINERNLTLLEELREVMISNIYFNTKKNSFEYRDKDIVKLQKIIRKIDWDFYIKKFSLLKDDPLIKDYREFLEIIIDETKINPNFVADKIILSNTYRTKFKKAIENDNIIKAYKILLITLAEWTDTTVSRKIKELKEYRLYI